MATTSTVEVLLSQTSGAWLQVITPFIGTDAPYQDGWDGAIATFEANNTLLASWTLEDGGSGSIVITVPEPSADVPWLHGRWSEQLQRRCHGWMMVLVVSKHS